MIGGVNDKGGSNCSRVECVTRALLKHPLGGGWAGAGKLGLAGSAGWAGLGWAGKSHYMEKNPFKKIPTFGRG